MVFDMGQHFPASCQMFPERHVRGKKRPRALSTVSESGDGDEEGPSIPVEKTTCTMCLRYNSMLCLDSVGGNELLVVEQPWLNVVATFPEALQRKVYAS